MIALVKNSVLTSGHVGGGRETLVETVGLLPHLDHVELGDTVLLHTHGHGDAVLLDEHGES